MHRLIILLTTLLLGWQTAAAQDSLLQAGTTIRDTSIEELVVVGNIRPISRGAGPVPIEIYHPNYFKKNPTASLFDAIGMINGVRPQLNCNVCNTGDIHINGMEGPYTLILIDGMPIVSALSTVYGLSGIPNSMVERLEVIKGPASVLFPGEAMGGTINVVTKNAKNAPLLSVDAMSTSWLEHMVDIGFKASLSKNVTSLTGINYFNYSQPFDKNKDGFTDLALQQRISIFNKINIARKLNREASIAARYVYEDRWGGQMNYRPALRGSDEIYGESIYTRRWELIGQYQLPFKEKIMAQVSYNNHFQNSWYGNTSYNGWQQVAFAQLYWQKNIGNHSLLGGASYRYTFYDDNTPGTTTQEGKNNAMYAPLPGLYLQDEWRFQKHHTLMPGYRFDYDKNHGGIHTPRLAYKWAPNNAHTLRASAGKGFRVVNLFTEDHAALTGSREVVIEEALLPEQSWNGNATYTLQFPVGENFVTLDATGFYSYFTNKIIGDYETNDNQIIYRNLSGHAVSRGLAINATATFSIPLQIIAGATFMDVYQKNDIGSTGTLKKTPQLFAPKWSGNFTVSYGLPYQFTIDLTGQVNGPMHLPLQENDYRPEKSPWFCLANIQVVKKFGKTWELYGGVKNIFNFIPKDVYMRPFDPFDKTANDPISNPNGYTFDTEYNYAPLQGARLFAGLRFNLH